MSRVVKGSTYRSAEPVSRSKLTSWPGVPSTTGHSHSRSSASAKPVSEPPAVKIRPKSALGLLVLGRWRMTLTNGSLVVTRIGQVSILGHSLEVGSWAIATLEGRIGSGIQSEASRVVTRHDTTLRQDGGHTTDNGDQKDKAKANGLLGAGG